MRGKLFNETPGYFIVFPAKAGIQRSPTFLWIPAFAGKTMNRPRIFETGH